MLELGIEGITSFCKFSWILFPFSFFYLNFFWTRRGKEVFINDTLLFCIAYNDTLLICICHHFLTLGPVDGSWGSWIKWSQCSQSCGGGTETRKRLCDSPAPPHSGAECQGDTSQQRQCNKEQCKSVSESVISENLRTGIQIWGQDTWIYVAMRIKNHFNNSQHIRCQKSKLST